VAKTNSNQERVRHYLRSGQLRIGDRLPGERQLALILGMGRAALRLVLEGLEKEGVLTRRPQSGTFLAAIPLPAGRGAAVTLIAPLQGTGEPERAAEPSWIYRVISAFERAATPAGIRLTLVNQSPFAGDPCAVLDLVRQAIGGGTQAVVLLHALGPRAKISHALALLHDNNIPSVVVSSRTFTGLASRVYFDSGWGAYLATRHLLTRGHRRIGFAGAPEGHEWVQERMTGYRNALEAADVVMDEQWLWSPGMGDRFAMAADGEAALQYYLSMSPERRPTGIVAANDTVALGLLAAAQRNGVAVPETLSLVGFDNDPDALFAGLTTVERPTEALGETVARVLLERLSARSETETVTVRLRPVLIERQTVGPPPMNVST
jgi:LacI family transcriptional regulator